jgi:nicotinamidase-related amidase
MRHEYLLSRADAVAIIVDVQERLLPQIAGGERVVRNIVKLLTAFEALGVPVLATEQNRKVFGPTAGPIRSRLPAEPHDKLVFSCLALEAVRDRLVELGRRQVIVAGIETHVCVCQTALDAVAAGYDVHVPFDACGAHTEEDHRIGLEKMRAGGVIPSSTEIVIFDLLERAGTDEFRRVLPLLKER